MRRLILFITLFSLVFVAQSQKVFNLNGLYFSSSNTWAETTGTLTISPNNRNIVVQTEKTRFYIRTEIENYSTQDETNDKGEKVTLHIFPAKMFVGEKESSVEFIIIDNVIASVVIVFEDEDYLGFDIGIVSARELLR